MYIRVRETVHDTYGLIRHKNIHLVISQPELIKNMEEGFKNNLKLLMTYGTQLTLNKRVVKYEWGLFC